MTLVLSRGIQLIFTVKAYSHGVTMIATVLDASNSLYCSLLGCLHVVTAIMASSQNGLHGSLLDISMVTLINMGPIN